MLTSTYQKHCSCQMEIRYKQFESGRLTPALFCSDHDVYLDWITQEQANQLIDQLNIPVRKWKDKTKQHKRTGPNLLARKRRNKKEIKKLEKKYAQNTNTYI